MNKPKSPRLRFPNVGKELTSNSLNELSLLVTSGSRDWAQFYSISGAKFIRMTNLRRGSPVLDLEELKYVCVPKTSRDGFRTKLEHGDVLVSITAELGKIGLVPKDIGDAYINQHVALVRPKKSDLCGFLAHYLTAPQTHKRLNRLNDSGAKSGLNLSTLKAFPVHSPETDECRKIADFLTSVDTKISQLAESYRLLKEYKKGVMQQIFGQLLRFKDENGNAFPEWEEKPLNQLASKVTTKNKSRLVKAVLTNSAKHGIISQQDYFDKEIAKEDNTDNYYVVDINDFVYNPRISELAPVGPIGRNNVEQGVMSPLYSVFRFKPEVCLDFIAYFFKGTAWHKYMHSVANFGARHDRMNISSADLMALPCPFPCIEEQKKIAQFLQSIDTKIEGVAEQVEQTKQFKKGLLQQMFV
ncbi:restriction endonuclease subunit S [Vibrio crassostreae]|uniref:restriction endonuclease subunit S n=1 Tax=Vibrio crassostreae TaxID=246167 RepID=UPI00148DC9E0|nr:restriction endonuclease subunit S [Vibrio crassostreae]NOH75461.1 restriction endonuclease subunit S [Vibrio crassostreae]